MKSDLLQHCRFAIAPQYLPTTSNTTAAFTLITFPEFIQAQLFCCETKMTTLIAKFTERSLYSKLSTHSLPIYIVSDHHIAASNVRV